MSEVSTKTTAEELENIEAEKTKDMLIKRDVKDDYIQEMRAPL